MFSKQAIYKALKLAKTILSDFNNLLAFVDAKKSSFIVAYKDRKWYKDIVKGSTDQIRQETFEDLIKPKHSSASKFTFPQFRLSCNKAT